GPGAERGVADLGDWVASRARAVARSALTWRVHSAMVWGAPPASRAAWQRARRAAQSAMVAWVPGASGGCRAAPTARRAVSSLRSADSPRHAWGIEASRARS